MSLAVVDSTDAAGTSNPFSINVPAGVADGDQLLLGVSVAGSSSPKVTTPTGWEVEQEYKSTAYHRVVFKRIASSEPASYSLSMTGSPAVARAAMIAINDSADEAGIASGESSINTGTTTSSFTATGITVGGDAILVYFALWYATASRTVTPPSGMTEVEDGASTGSSVYTGAEIAHAAVTAGATGNKTGTASGNGNYSAFLVAVRSLASSGNNTLFFGSNF